jgi:hypothetical protein
MRLGENEPWIPMVKTEEEDPIYVKVVKAEKGLNLSSDIALPDADKCMHLWKANLPKNLTAGTYLITVRTTDMFGHTYIGQRIVRIR